MISPSPSLRPAISSHPLDNRVGNEKRTEQISAPSPKAEKRAKQTPQQGFTIFHGMNWSGWKQTRRLKTGSSRGYVLRHAAITAMSAMNSVNERIESAVYGRKIRHTEITEAPIFILGHWRSGTTLLHDLMALDTQLTYPNLYQVMFPGHFLLTEDLITRITAGLLPKTRPMDNMAIRWNGSQEDEIALLVRTQVSPYNMLFCQGEPERYRRYLDLTDITPEERETWKREFLTFLKKLTVRSPKPIVLKSPSHTCRIPLLLEMFPTARFVYLYRDPYAVYASSMHLRRTLFKENALSAPNFAGLEEDMLWIYNHTIARYEATKHLVPPGRLHEVRFEDLEADPLNEMRGLYEALNLPGWDQIEPRLQAELPRLAAYKKNAFKLDPATMRRVYESSGFAFDTYGYPSRLSEAEISPASEDVALMAAGVAAD